MTNLDILDVVEVATTARAARDAAQGATPPAERPELLPDSIAIEVARARSAAEWSAAQAILTRYALELDQITESAVLLDQCENELDHQLRWWAERIAALEEKVTGIPVDDMAVSRELALYRGRLSGAQAMVRHYAEERRALTTRHRDADAACALALASRN